MRKLFYNNNIIFYKQIIFFQSLMSCDLLYISELNKNEKLLLRKEWL